MMMVSCLVFRLLIISMVSCTESLISFSKSMVTLIEGTTTDILVVLDNAVGINFSVRISANSLLAIGKL